MSPLTRTRRHRGVLTACGVVVAALFVSAGTALAERITVETDSRSLAVNGSFTPFFSSDWSMAAGTAHNIQVADFAENRHIALASGVLWTAIGGDLSGWSSSHSTVILDATWLAASFPGRFDRDDLANWKWERTALFFDDTVASESQVAAVVTALVNQKGHVEESAVNASSSIRGSAPWFDTLSVEVFPAPEPGVWTLSWTGIAISLILIAGRRRFPKRVVSAR